MTCSESDIENRNSVNHDKCCLDTTYKSRPGCAKCYDAVYTNFDHPKHNECCKENPTKCCNEDVFSDPTKKDYNLCCDHLSN